MTGVQKGWLVRCEGRLNCYRPIPIPLTVIAWVVMVTGEITVISAYEVVRLDEWIRDKAVTQTEAGERVNELPLNLYPDDPRVSARRQSLRPVDPAGRR